MNATNQRTDLGDLSDIARLSVEDVTFSETLPIEVDETEAHAHLDEIYKRHNIEVERRAFLAVLRQESGMSLKEVAQVHGTTKANIHHAERRELSTLSVGRMLEQLKACGYDVDVEWLENLMAKDLVPTSP